MRFSEQTFETVEENLAADQIALEWVAREPGEGILRLWEIRKPAVVLGMGGRWLEEVVRENATGAGIPVVRRLSGGGPVVLAQGCLNYSLIMPMGFSSQLMTPSSANDWIMDRHRCLCSVLSGLEVERAGCTDLAVGARKFSGNAQKRGGGAVLFHGTFLLNMDLDLVGRLLKEPSCQPEYRHQRTHADFLTNLNVCREELSAGLRRLWGADREVVLVAGEWAVVHSQLVRERYANPEWNLRR